MLLLKTISCNGTDLFWPFFWWLLGAFLLGLLIPWLLRILTGSGDGGDWKDKYDSLDGKYNVMHNSNAKLQKDYDALKLQSSKEKTDGIDWKKKYDDLNAKTDDTDWKAKYEECVSEKSMAAGMAGAAGAALGFASGPNEDTGQRDDLTKVEGIGPKINEMIYEGGIYTFKQLSEADVNYLRSILDKAGPAFKVHQPGTWPAQAKMADEGRWDELHKWQDELKGGK